MAAEVTTRSAGEPVTIKSIGESGDDYLYRESGNDTIGGGSGNDHIYDGSGTDSMTGSSGADTFVFSSDGVADTVVDFQKEGIATGFGAVASWREIADAFDNHGVLAITDTDKDTIWIDDEDVPWYHTSVERAEVQKFVDDFVTA